MNAFCNKELLVSDDDISPVALFDAIRHPRQSVVHIREVDHFASPHL
jgi:hypothetical protein